MGAVLSGLALLKLRDLVGFADAFEQYDILAARSRAYALAYPFLELGLGILFLTKTYSSSAAGVLGVLMLISLFGVGRAIIRRKQLVCACMGTGIRVPLTTLTLTENLVMGVMAYMVLTA
jgi:hypothetical protein